MEDEQLIDTLYEAAVVPERWRDFLSLLARRHGATDALCSRVRDGRIDFLSTSEAFKETWDVILSQPGGVDNERTRRLVAAQHAGFIADDDVFAPGEAASLPLYRDILIPRGYGSGAATAVAVPNGDLAIINIEKPIADGPFSRKTIVALDAIRPHFARAAFISNRLEADRARTATIALELVGLPAAILGRRGQAIAMNGLLEAMIPHLVQDRPSRLALVDLRADALFTAAMATIDRPGLDLPVRSIPVSARGDHPPVIFHLTPIRGAAHDVLARALAVLVATPVVPRRVPNANVVQGLFDLTPSEAKLAALVAGGHAPRAAAARLGWTYETARTSLKRLMAKVGVERQAELAGLLSFNSFEHETKW